MKDNQTIAQFLGITDFPFIIKDDDGNSLYYENSDKGWNRCEYNSSNDVTYFEDSNKYWFKHEFDSNGHCTYYENSNKFWNRCEYNSNRKETYYEDSDGVIRGAKRKETSSLEGDILIHNGQTYKLVK